MTRAPVVRLCEICRKPTTAGRHYCLDHRDPRPLPERVELLRWIDAQQCPLCRDGRTFKVLANHTVKAHGITGDEIRERAGLILAARICSPEFTDEHRDRMRPYLNAQLDNLRVGHERGGGPDAGPRMRAYVRLARLHPEDYQRLLAEERT